MRVTHRARRAGLAVAMAAVIGGGGIAACAAARAPAASPQAAAAVPSSAPGSAGSGAAVSYAPAVRNVLPSVTAIHTSGLTPARFGDSGRAQVGDVVLAVGNPLGLSGSVTEGIISATGRAVTEPATATAPATALPDTIQTSAPINPGTAAGADGAPAGAAVVAVTPGGPAERAGLRPGDVIHRLGPAPALDATTLLEALAAAQPGQEVQVTITRAGQTHTVPVTLGTLHGG